MEKAAESPRKKTTKSPKKPDIKEFSKQKDGGTQKKEPKKDKKLATSQKFVKLKRDLSTMETNIQAAAEAREVQCRTEIDKARKIRLELLEDHNLSSKNKLEQICNGWQTSKEKVVPQEVQAALNHQLQLFDELITEKKRVMDIIQQDLKARDESFVADLKKQTEELQLMLERMDEQDTTLTKAYREELEQWAENVQKEEETKRIEEKTAWEKCIKNLLDTEIEKLSQRQQAVEEFNTQLNDLIFETYENFNVSRNKEVAFFQAMELEIHQVASENIFMEQKLEKLTAENIKLKSEHTRTKAKVSNIKSELSKLRMNKQTAEGKEKQLMEKHLMELNHKVQDYERLQKKKIHFAIADAIKFENMWLTEEAEVKELLERALYVDSMIYEQVLRIPWVQPNLSFANPGKRWEERCTVSQISQCIQDQLDVTQVVAEESIYNESESEAEVGERSSVATPKTVKRLMELLCEEAGFLFEVKIMNLLDSLDDNERTPMKMGYLFNTLGINEKNVPKLVDFLYKYGQQCTKDCDDAEVTQPSGSTDQAETSSAPPVTPDPIDRNDVLQALKCFLDRYNQERVKWSVQSLEARDMSKEKAYWESLGNAMTAEKLKIWEITEMKLEHHHTVLSDISKLTQEIQSLQQENTELQMVHMFLQQVCLDQSFSLSPDVTQIGID
ncbi:hypothetical protein WMY93_016360 [Mugilogobius chulae]|uniref:Dynein regulatory complex protein 1 n=1 Tax=Mugilogobius chulae TaxID=88201 RepID=A0AAW0P4Z5_9GOBI